MRPQLHTGRARAPGGPLLPLALPLFAFLLIFAAPPASAQSASVRVEIKDLKNAPVADAVASLTPLDRTPAVTPPRDPVVISQLREEFLPYVTVVPVGARVRFPNNDKVQHHVFSLSKTKSFDLGLYHGEPKELVTFDQPGVVSLGCNIHDWMSAYVVVLATPHFAKSDTTGLAPIVDLPAGRYRLEVWHPRIKQTITRELALETSSIAQVISVTLGVDRRLRRAPETPAAGYR